GRRGDARQRLGRDRRPARCRGVRRPPPGPLNPTYCEIPTREGPSGPLWGGYFAISRERWGSGVEGVELGLGHGIRVGVEPHVGEQRLHDAQGCRGPFSPVREVAELPPPQRLYRSAGLV